MRHPFPTQPDWQLTPSAKIRRPRPSRAELPPSLAGLQWVWLPPALKAEIFALLEAKILAGKQAPGRIGMNLWQILVLGGVRLGLAADWERLEHVANYDALVRQMLGVPAAPWGEGAKRFGQPTLRDNIALLEDELLPQINARGAGAPSGPLWVGDRRAFPHRPEPAWGRGLQVRGLGGKVSSARLRAARLAAGQGLAAAVQEPPARPQPDGLSRRAEQGSRVAKTVRA